MTRNLNKHSLKPTSGKRNSRMLKKYLMRTFQPIMISGISVATTLLTLTEIRALVALATLWDSSKL